MSALALKRIAEAKEKYLTILDLGSCGLTEIPEAVFELVWLKELSFSHNYPEWNEAKLIIVCEPEAGITFPTHLRNSIA